MEQLNEVEEAEKVLREALSLSGFVDCTEKPDQLTLSQCYFNLGVLLLTYGEKLPVVTTTKQSLQYLMKSKQIKLACNIPPDDPAIIDNDTFINMAEEGRRPEIVQSEEEVISAKEQIEN